MATVVDALVLTFQLDPTQFNDAQKQAMEHLDNLEKQSLRSGKTIEAEGKKLNEFFVGLKREALAFFGISFGATEARRFLDYITNMDAATGRLSKTIGVSTRELSAWGNAAKAIGGTGTEPASMMKNIEQELYNFRFGAGSNMINMLTRQMGLRVFDEATGEQAMTADQIMRAVNEIMNTDARFRNMPTEGKASWLRLMGFDETSVNLLVQTRQELDRLLEAGRKAAPSPADIAAGREYQRAFSQLDASAGRLGTTLTTLVAPGLTSAADGLNRFINELRGGDWKAAGNDLLDFLKKLYEASQWISPFPFPVPVKIRDWLFRKITGEDKSDALSAAKSDLAEKLARGGGGGGGTAAQALLDRIAASEGGQYDIEYGGMHFTDFSRHPHHEHMILTGPNARKMTSAAGRYQFEYGKWMEAQKALNLPDFSPASQDKAAWWLAQRDYMARTGRNLSSDVNSTDPSVRAGISSALSKTWTSLPGGIEQRRTQGQFWAPPRFEEMNRQPVGAGAAAAGRTSYLDRSRGDVTTTTTVQNMTVNSRAADAAGIAADIKVALEQQAFAAQANYSLS